MASNAAISEVLTKTITNAALTTETDTINIVTIGKLGKGKSTLVNGLIGRQVAIEKASAHAVTQKIEYFSADFEIEDASGNKKVITVKIWDTPGLNDPDMDDDKLESYQTELAGHAKNADLILYCIDMRGRLERSEITELKELTNTTGPLVWKNTMIVLTFANKVVPEEAAVDPKTHFKKVLESWNDQIRTQLKKKLALSEDIIQELPIVPTGYQNKPPPDRVDWFSPFWGEAFRKVKESAQLNLVAINAHRLTEGEASMADEEPYKMKISIQEIMATYEEWGRLIRESCENIVIYMFTFLNLIRIPRLEAESTDSEPEVMEEMKG